jgi:transposase
MEKLPRQVYTSEFRQQAVELVTRAGLGTAEASATPRREVMQTEAELPRLRRENAERRMERDILKKSAAYFASESWRATRCSKSYGATARTTRR